MSMMISASYSRHENKPSISNVINITQSKSSAEAPTKSVDTKLTSDITTSVDGMTNKVEASAPPAFAEYPNVIPMASLPINDLHNFELDSYLLFVLRHTIACDRKLLNHLIESSNEIIVTKDQLKHMIHILLGPAVHVEIFANPILNGCCVSSLLHQSVEKILINGQDFFIAHNTEFNLISGRGVSMRSVLEDDEK